MKKACMSVICIAFCIFGSMLSYAQKVSTDLANNIFRIHIIANSDSKEDQELKLKVRDSIIQYFSNCDLHFSNIEECINYYNNHIEEINMIIQKTLEQNNSSYIFNTKICKSYFPTKEYDYFSLPTGTYSCLRVEIGKAEGQNWWCVLYPNLCITDIGTTEDSKELLKNAVSTNSYEIITNNISYKFKIIELIEEFSALISNNKIL